MFSYQIDPIPYRFVCWGKLCCSLLLESLIRLMLCLAISVKGLVGPPIKESSRRYYFLVNSQISLLGFVFDSRFEGEHLPVVVIFLHLEGKCLGLLTLDCLSNGGQKCYFGKVCQSVLPSWSVGLKILEEQFTLAYWKMLESKAETAIR